MRRRGKLESQKANRLSYGSQWTVTQKWGNFGERVRRPRVLMLSNSSQREGEGKKEKEKLHSLKPPSLREGSGGLQRKGGDVQSLAKKEFP